MAITGKHILTDGTRAQAIDAALRIAEEMLARSTHPGKVWTSDLTLGQGASGIALFFSELFRLTDDNRMRVVAEQLAREIIDNWQSLDVEKGWATGRLGAAFSLCQIADAIEREDIAEFGAMQLLRSADIQHGGDVYHGISGALLALLRMYEMTSEAPMLAKAERLGRRLLARHVRPRTNGAALISDRPVLFPLIGFAHGASGCAIALGALAGAIDEPLFDYVGRSLLQYEDSNYRYDWRNWPDGRRSRPVGDSGGTGSYHDSDGPIPAHRVAWCGGRSGLATARVVALRWELIQVATGLDATERDDRWLWVWRGMGETDHNLCCGFGGAVEFHIQKWLSHDRDGSASSLFVERCLEALFELYDTTGDWISPRQLAKAGSHDGFLRGRAGVGLLLLRSVDPHRIQSQLLLGAGSRRQKVTATSIHLDRYRRRALASLVSRDASSVGMGKILGRLETGGAASVGGDAIQMNAQMEMSSDVAEIERLALRYRTQSERSVSLTPVLPEQDAYRKRVWVLSSNAGVFADDERSIVVGLCRGVATTVVLRDWARLVVDHLRRPMSKKAIIRAVQGKRHGSSPSSAAIWRIVEMLRHVGAVMAVEPKRPARRTGPRRAQ